MDEQIGTLFYSDPSSHYINQQLYQQHNQPREIVHSL